MRKMKDVVVIVAVLFVAASIALAQEAKKEPELPIVKEMEKKGQEKETRPKKVVELPECVVTPGRMEEPVAEITESITVITSAQLEDSAALDVAETLRTVPGINLHQYGGIGGTCSIRIRGMDPEQTVVLIDGIQINDPSFDYMFDFDDLDTSNIERIEVIRGVEAAMYGPGAVGGVINIITKKGKGKPRTVTRVLGGSFGTGHVQLGTTGSRSGVSHSFAISQLTTDNVGSHNQSDKTTLSGSMCFELDKKRSIDIFTRYISSRHEEPYQLLWSPSRIELDSNFTREQDQTVLGAKYHHKVSGVFSLDASFSAFRTDSWLLNDADDDSGAAEMWSSHEASVLTGRVQGVCNLDEVLNTPGAKSRVLLGVEYTWENWLKADNWTPTPAPERVRNRAAYLQTRFRPFEKLLLSASTRVDTHTTYDTNWSPTLGLKLDLWEGGAIRGNLSRAIRPPSSEELYGTYGNPDLKKERRNGFDAGFVQKLFSEKVELEITYFHIRIGDCIGWPLPTSWNAENFDKHAEGIEVSAGLAPVKDFLIDLSFSHIAARNYTYHIPIPGQSPNFGSVRIRRRMGKFTLTLTGYFSENVPPEGILDEKGRQQKNAGKADLVNFALLYKVTGSSKFTFKVTNILDRRYKESERAPRVPGIGLFAGISLEL